MKGTKPQLTLGSNNHFLHRCQSQRGDFPKLTDALGAFYRSYDIKCQEEKDVSQRKIQLCTYFLLCQTHVMGKNEKAYVSVPIFLFTHYVTLAGHPF